MAPVRRRAGVASSGPRTRAGWGSLGPLGRTDFWFSLARPGPVEEAMLAELAGSVEIHRPIAAGVGLRVLELGEGPPIVLLHGRGHSALMWWPLLLELSKRHRVIAFDLPGFGHSTGPPFSGEAADAIEYFTRPVEAWLESELPEGFVLCGHSLGGLVSLSLLLRRRVRPSKLVLVAPMGVGSAMSAGSRAYFRAGPERLARWLGPRVIRALTSSFPRDANGGRLDALSYELSAVYGGRPGAQAAFDALCPLGGPPYHLFDRLGEVDVPTLLVWGDGDRVFPSPVGLAAAARIPNARLAMFPLGHCPHVEAPDLFLGALASFLEEGRAVEQVPARASGRAAAG